MFKKSSFLLIGVFALCQSYAHIQDSLNTSPIKHEDGTYRSYKPEDGTFSTYLMVSGLINNFNIGMEKDANYLFFGGGNYPVFNLKYQYKAAHHWGLKLGVNNTNSGSLRTDSLKNRSSVNTSKMSRFIPINSSLVWFMQDDNSSSTKNILFVPFYEYHFKGNKRWDYYVGAEYVLKLTANQKSKNFETLTLTNSNGDITEYTYRYTKNGALSNRGIILNGGVNFFIYKWLSVGTKISFSAQSYNPSANDFEEKVTVNGVDKTATMINSSTAKTVNNRSTYSGFLNNGFTGIMVNFYL